MITPDLSRYAAELLNALVYEPEGMRSRLSSCRTDDELIEALSDVGLTAAGWDESKHPRTPAGSKGGGRWTRVDRGGDLGYENEDVQVLDNSGGAPGYAGAKGSGRWAVMKDGKWISNEDTLPEAKAKAVEASDVLTAAGWDESKHPRHTAGVREGGRFRGNIRALNDPIRRVEHLPNGARVKLTGEIADGKVYTVTDSTPVGTKGHYLVTVVDEQGNSRKLAGTAGVEHLPDASSIPEPEMGVEPTPAPDAPAAPAATPEFIDVTGRSLKVGDTFTDGNGKLWVVDKSAGGLGRYMQVREVATGDRRIMKAGQKVTVKAADHAAAAKRLAAVSVSHVEGGYGQLFEKSPGPGTMVTKAANAASAEFDAHLTMPADAPKFTKGLVETRSNTIGGGYAHGSRDGTTIPQRLLLRAEKDNPDVMVSNMHHEVGHYIDSTVLADPEAMSSTKAWASVARQPHVAGPVMDAIDASPPVQRINAMAESAAEFGVVRGGTEPRTMSIDRAHVSYVREPQEKFARAYEQYQATKAGRRLDTYHAEAALPLHDRTLDPGDDYRSFYGWYWSSEDFKPIERELDAMFGRLGWSKS